VRRLALGIATVALVAGCSHPAREDPYRPPGGSGPRPTASGRINPDRINRIRGDLPREYEAGALAAPVYPPAGYWGFRSSWVADPQPCGRLATAGVSHDAARGLSASGPGGILYVAVIDQPEAVVDPALLAQCATWTISSEHSSGLVRLGDPPPVDHAQTTAMTAAIRTVVESGTETASLAYTYSAYADDHVVFVVLVTDPGAAVAPLDPQFAADLLVKAVAALRA
jgi:Domain of unknown function (DUF5642)